MGGADGLGDDVDNIEKDANVRNDAQWDAREHAVHLERIESCAYHTELDATYAREYAHRLDAFIGATGVQTRPDDDGRGRSARRARRVGRVGGTRRAPSLGASGWRRSRAASPPLAAGWPLA
eukprot:ctg_1132.g357